MDGVRIKSLFTLPLVFHDPAYGGKKKDITEGHTGLIRFAFALCSGLYFVCYYHSVIPIYFGEFFKAGEYQEIFKYHFFFLTSPFVPLFF